MYVYRKQMTIFLNPEGIICEKTWELHTIPSGLRKNAVIFPINIHSLREYVTP